MNFDFIDTNWVQQQLSFDREKFFAFMDELTEPRFPVSQMGISRQELLYWKKLQVLVLPESDHSSVQRTWNKVNFFDYCWLQLVAKLREVNMPLEIIAKFRSNISGDNDNFYKQLFSELNKFELDNPAVQKLRKDFNLDDLYSSIPSWLLNDFKKIFSPFNLIILRLMENRKPLNLWLNYDGDYFFIQEDLFKKENFFSDMFQFTNKPFVNIPVADLLNKFYSSESIKPKDKKAIFNLTEQETKVLELLRNKGIKEIRIRLTQQHKGQIVIETVQEKSIPALQSKISTLLAKGGYQNIRLYAEKGNLLLFEETKKIKI